MQKTQTGHKYDLIFNRVIPIQNKIQFVDVKIYYKLSFFSGDCKSEGLEESKIYFFIFKNT